MRNELGVRELSWLAPPGQRLEHVVRLRGGSKKGVYRLTFDDGFSAIGYVWDEDHNYWPMSAHAVDDGADPFADASGSDLLAANTQYLENLGIRVPKIYALDQSHANHPGDVALVEDLRGGSLEQLLQRDRPAGERALDQLARMLDHMHSHHGSHFGKVTTVAQDGYSESRSAADVVLVRALSHLEEAVHGVPRIADVREQLEDVARELAARVPARSTYGLIHSELGPDHVFIDDDGDAVLIDLEGLMFFDVEWEHVFLRIRFGDDYDRLAAAVELDERRLAFYGLAEYLSLVAGPLRLLDGGEFPDLEFMKMIVESNTERVLAYAERQE